VDLGSDIVGGLKKILSTVQQSEGVTAAGARK
jgi:hypothetical protein